MTPKIVSYVPKAIKAVRDATAKGQIETAVKVTTQAKSLAPVRSGQLRNSIMWATRNNDGLNSGGSKISRPSRDLVVRVGTAVEHGVYQEFGTRYMAAQPFLRPAVFIVVDGAGYITAISKAMEDTVQQKMRGL